MLRALILCVVAFSRHAAGCTYQVVTRDSETGFGVESTASALKKTYISDAYCGADHIGLANAGDLVWKPKNWTVGKPALCGTYHSAYGSVNSTFVVGPLKGSEGVWNMASAKVIKQCYEITEANSGDDFNEALFASCYNTCTYRTDGSIFKPGHEHPPETFEYLYAPFFGAVPVRKINTLQSVNGYGEMAPNFLALLLIDFDVVKTKLDAGPATFMPLAEDTVLLSAFLSQYQHPTTLLTAVFPLGNSSLPFFDFVGALAGGESDSSIFCGETFVGPDTVLNATCKPKDPPCYDDAYVEIPCGCDGPGLKFISGTLEGDDIQCSSPFVFGYMQMLNTTFSGEEVYASELALSLKKPNGMLDDADPKIGAFEELVGAVCPHAFLWTTEGLDMAKASFLDKVESYATLDDDIVADTVCGATESAGLPLFDELSGRFILEGSADAFHFVAPVVYMPSFLEVFVWNKFKLIFKDWIGGTEITDIKDAANALIRIKMRYVSQIAMARAESEVLSINSRPITAGDCLDDPEAENVGNKASMQICNQEECSVCQMLAQLTLITKGCLLCTSSHTGQANLGTCPDCRTQVTKLFANLNAACTGKCNDKIIEEYLCTAATSGMVGQASCGTYDALSYLVSYLPFGMSDAMYGASGYYGYYGSVLTNMAYKSALSLGYGASAFAYTGDCYYYGACGRRLSNDAPLGPGFPLGGHSNTGNRRLAEVYEATPWGDFMIGEDYSGLDYATGKALLEALQNGVVIGTTASILSSFLDEILPSNPDTWIKEVVSMVAKNVNAIGVAWKDIGVPVSVTCDPDFEESAVRDALKLASLDEPGCPVPVPFVGSMQARFLNSAWKNGFASVFWSG